MRSTILRSIGRGFVRFIALLNGIATAWTFIIMFLMTFDVLGRALFNHPITGTPELVRISIVGIVFMQIPHTFWVGRHIRSDIFLRRFSPLMREVSEIGICLFGAAVFTGIVVSSVPVTITAWRVLEYEGAGALPVPTYPIRTLIILGSALTSIIFFFRSYESVMKIKDNRRMKS